MQRSITYQNALNDLFWIVLFAVYIGLSSIYLFLPPMAAVLFYMYDRALQRHDLYALIVVSLMLLMFEAEKGFWFGSTIVFFTLISHYLIPKLEQMMRCPLCIKGIFVLVAYLGFWVFIGLVNSIVILPLPAIDWHILFYMAIEFALIAIFG